MKNRRQKCIVDSVNDLSSTQTLNDPFDMYDAIIAAYPDLDNLCTIPLKSPIKLQKHVQMNSELVLEVLYDTIRSEGMNDLQVLFVLRCRDISWQNARTRPSLYYQLPQNY